MKPDAWARVREVFEAALDRDPEQRAAYLDQACAGQQELRDEVASLLAAHETATDFIESPAYDLAPELLLDDATSRVGHSVGPYLVRDEIGRGGMGIVYLADDTRLSRRVALKAITPGVGPDAGRRERLRREARAAAALSHPGIATVYALEEIDDELYLACEYVPGPTLRALIERGPFPLLEVIDIAAQLSRALAAAHAQGVVHRDLKPENIVRGPAGVIKVLDFGIARVDSFSGPPVTAAGTIVGTPNYMSPEQFRGSDVDFRADVFALGLIVYEMAAGSNPFEGTKVTETIARVLELDPPALSNVRSIEFAGLDRIVATCLRKRREERYASTQALVQDLERLQNQVLARRASSDAVTPGGLVASDSFQAGGAKAWWSFHQLAASVVCLLMIYPAWHARHWLASPSNTAFILTIVASAAASTTVRLHLLFTARFDPTGLRAQCARTLPWVRASDIAFSTALIFAAFGIGNEHPEVATLLVAVSIAVTLASFIIEPATTRAALGAPVDGGSA